MSDLLSIGRSGLKAYARSMETVSHNIANAENPDYVRRSTLLSDATVSGKLNPLYANQSGLNGVRIVSTTRSSDDFLETQVRQTGASRIRTEIQTGWMERIETNLNNAGSNVGTRLNSFFGRGEELAAAPFDNALRLTFVAEIDAVVDSFKRTSRNLQLTSEQVVQTAELDALTLNSALNNLNELNLNITRTPVGTDAHAGLLDARDSMLAVITEKLDATISLSGNGTATVTYDGQTLAGVNIAAEVTVATNADGSLGILINGNPARSPSNGSLAGLSRAGSTVQTRIAEIEALARQFVDDVNAWNANGVTAAGTPGPPLVTMTGGVATLATTTSAIADIAAASADGTPNGNLLKLTGLRTTDGVETRWNNFMAGHATALASIRSEAAAASALDSSARKQRDSVSLVELDREAADLIRLQQAYEASARVIQVAREALQSILSIF
ncbi:flagellar hook-associated protein FlgK [Blastomonas aquatica]|uniref:Flagellar hook-associated protein 1 n=1 Tax=Blastomonas aquatica TaxID=1510276 RepID=A0ABQ1IW52_9SPHN|nr:flagellar hook-associated protein FlgK [Blastomonas aquatica]GGB52570.1 flagellar hook-associated protein 1 [Blastomonas aquatica]